MKPLEHPDSLHLQAAIGWLELGNHLEADKELDDITPQLRAHPDVLLVRCDIYSAGNKWDYVIAVADTLVKQVPNLLRAWIHRSYALHELHRTQEAHDQLLPAAGLFPRNYLVSYNLACYTAQLGRIQQAEDWFKRAMALDENTVKRIAIDDPDLEPLWQGMQGSSWKRAS